VSLSRTVQLLIWAVLLSACASSNLDRRYLDATLDQPLELPPDLSQQDTRSNFDLPEAFSGDDPNERGKVPVLAQVESLRLQGSSGFYWLEVDASVGDLYQHIKNFWASEGYGLVVDEPIIGTMQTEWIYKEEGRDQSEQSWWETLFSSKDLSASQDQFRTRIERDESSQLSRVYITHRGTEYVHEISVGNRDVDTGSKNEWQFRQPEPELEVEMLSRLMIYLGLQQQAVDEQVARVKLFKPRASLQLDAEEQSPFILIKDSYQIAWNRVYHVLQRMNFEIKTASFQSGFSGEGVIIVEVDVVKDVDKGFFAFSAADERETRQFTLVLSEESASVTRLVIEDEGGNFDTSVAGGEFVSLLYENIK
jgi:outer membrane protein assembly factor BamC